MSYLTEALVEMGHDVTLFASGDSQTSAKLEAVWPQALRLDPTIRDVMAPHMLLLEEVRRRADEFDVLHFHIDYYPFRCSRASRAASDDAARPPRPAGAAADLQHVQRRAVVSISDTSAFRCLRPTAADDLPRPARELLKPIPDVKPSYLAFLGRISPEKRVDTAIRIAEQAGMPIKIAAKLDKADRAYYEERSSRSSRCRTSSTSARSAKPRRPTSRQRARAAVPIDWPEPFGLVMIEAMACGTPVIAFKRGSCPK
ncbi:glycosyltransferase [Burkholderia mallei]|uniref:glycosyltransferase n=1 Tax=Burkholderia mallei TaxID=13373 RepID=UPI0030B824D1